MSARRPMRASRPRTNNRDLRASRPRTNNRDLRASRPRTIYASSAAHPVRGRLARMTTLCMIVASIIGCRADDPIKQGEVGELCNGRDTDCREGLVCSTARVCEEPGSPLTYDCSDACTRLSTECDAAEPGCESDCRITVGGWSLRAREEFGICLVEDLTCAEARADFAPQTCYSRIEIPDERFALCEDFADEALGCGAARSDAERVLEGCAAIARVGPDVVWMGPQGCGPLLETGNCAELATCFNSELGLDPAIEFVTF